MADRIERLWNADHHHVFFHSSAAMRRHHLLAGMVQGIALKPDRNQPGIFASNHEFFRKIGDQRAEVTHPSLEAAVERGTCV